jgi:hypothetical protein
MKQILFVLIAAGSLLLLSFNPADTASTEPVEKTDMGKPRELTGKWLNGTFSMSN